MPLFRMRLCPYCQGFEKLRTSIRWYEVPLLLVLIRPYRCAVCFKRCRHFMF